VRLVLYPQDRNMVQVFELQLELHLRAVQHYLAAIGFFLVDITALNGLIEAVRRTILSNIGGRIDVHHLSAFEGVDVGDVLPLQDGIVELL